MITKCDLCHWNKFLLFSHSSTSITQKCRNFISQLQVSELLNVFSLYKSRLKEKSQQFGELMSLVALFHFPHLLPKRLL